MTECNKTTTVAELPTCTEVSRDSYLIVQSDQHACKVKVSDLVLGNENVDFYDQIQQLVQKVNDLTSIIQANSANWNDTTTTVNTNKTTWDKAGDVTTINQTLADNQADWTDTKTTMSLNSANWENTYLEVDKNKDKWTYSYDVVNSSQRNWDAAYTASIDGLGAIHEALELVNTSPWFKSYTNGLTEAGGTLQPTFAQVTAIWAEWTLKSSQWDSVYNIVYANSGSWE